MALIVERRSECFCFPFFTAPHCKVLRAFCCTKLPNAGCLFPVPNNDLQCPKVENGLLHSCVVPLREQTCKVE